MRIALIQPRLSYYVGGGEKVALRHAEFLSEIKGNKVTVFTIKPTANKYSELYLSKKESGSLLFVEKEIPEKYKHIYDVEPGINQIRWDNESVLFANLIHENIKLESFDVVLSYYIVDSLFKNLSIPNVVYLGGYPRKRIPMYASFLNFCDATISNSKNVKKLWSEDFKESGVTKNYILRKGADIPELSNKGGSKNIVFAGRLIKRKGVERLIDVFSKIEKKISDVNLYILGDGPLKEELESKVSRLGIEDKVVFTGTVQNVQEYFLKSGVCVFPSIEGEGLMTVVAEAMACGAPVITSKDMGSDEIIDDQKTGFLISIKNNDLEDIILKCLSDPKTCSEIRERAREFAKDNFSWAKVAKELNSILEEVVSNY